MREFINSETFILSLTIACYYVGTLIQRWVKKPYANPLLIGILLVIPVLVVLDIDYPTYAEGSHIISFLLGPTVVALGFTLYKQIDYIKGNIRSILISIAVGSVVGVLSVLAVCALFGSPKEVMISLESKSVTTPIAIGLCEKSGGIPSLTAIVVVVCGIFGSVVGPWFLDLISVKSKVARGLAMGAAAHGIGTSRALQMGQVEGALAGMAIGLMGIMTAIAIPIIEKIVF